ncbi:hypothetical protein PspLS_05393 [Pyricularia sp. CBS 133598]|nr:hypothetical protein PspLS_05393 [Pyricularia sp. CBS 133598]
MQRRFVIHNLDPGLWLILSTAANIPISYLHNPDATCKTMLFALRVYALADRLLVPQLSALCLKQYKEAMMAAEKDIMWLWDHFGEVVEHAYENWQSKALKSPLLRLVIKKRWIHVFWESLELLMYSIPAF